MLGSHLIDTVDVDWIKWVLFIDWQIVGPTINLSRARKDNAYVVLDIAAYLQERKLASAIDVQIFQRILQKS